MRGRTEGENGAKAAARMRCEQETGRMLLKGFRASLGVIKTAAAAMPGNGRGKYLKTVTVSRPVGSLPCTPLSLSALCPCPLPCGL